MRCERMDLRPSGAPAASSAFASVSPAIKLNRWTGLHAMTIRVGGPVLGWWILVASAIANVGQFEAEMSSDAFQLQVRRRPPALQSSVLLLEGATSRAMPHPGTCKGCRGHTIVSCTASSLQGECRLAGVSTHPAVLPQPWGATSCCNTAPLLPSV